MEFGHGETGYSTERGGRDVSRGRCGCVSVLARQIVMKGMICRNVGRQG